MEQFFLDLKNGILIDLLGKISAFVPRMAIALVVFFIGWVIARLASNILKRVLVSLKVDELGKKLNEVDFMQENKVEVRISTLICTALYYMVVMIFLIASTDILGVPVISNFVGGIIDYFPKMLSALAIVLIGVFVSDLISKLVRTTCESLGIPSAKIISGVVFYLLFITILVSALAQANIETSFLANNITVMLGAGALAFAIGYGLASRDLASNYLATFYNKNKVRVGDEIVMEGVRGKVVLIDTNSLVVQTNDSAIIFPLSKLTTQKVEIIYPEGQDERLITQGPKQS
jgi:small-conductance mechanosensitive channel